MCRLRFYFVDTAVVGFITKDTERSKSFDVQGKNRVGFRITCCYTLPKQLWKRRLGPRLVQIHAEKKMLILRSQYDNAYSMYFIPERALFCNTVGVRREDHP